jgi:hypothetical protein
MHVVKRLVAMLMFAMVLPPSVAEAGTTERASVDSDEG